MEFASNFQVVSTPRSFEVVSRVFHLFFKDFLSVSIVFQGSFETIQLSFKGVLRVFSRMYQGLFMEV